MWNVIFSFVHTEGSTEPPHFKSCERENTQRESFQVLSTRLTLQKQRFWKARLSSNAPNLISYQDHLYAQTNFIFFTVSETEKCQFINSIRLTDSNWKAVAKFDSVTSTCRKKNHIGKPYLAKQAKAYCFVSVLLQLNTSRRFLALPRSFLFLSLTNSTSSMSISLIWDTTINWSVRPYLPIIVLAGLFKKLAVIVKQKRRERNMLHLCTTAKCFCIVSGLKALGTVGHFRNYFIQVLLYCPSYT